MKVEEIKEHLEKLSIGELNDIKSFLESTIEAKKVGNIPIGESFEFDGKEYIVKEDTPSGCFECAFCNDKKTCKYLCCSAKYRYDKRDVIFIKK